MLPHLVQQRLKIILNILNILPLVLTLSSCAGIQSDLALESADIAPLSSVEVNMQRASINSRDFEHYKLAGDVLFYECGTFEGGRRKVTESDVLQIRADRSSTVLKVAAALSKNIDPQKESLAKSASAESFYDAGIYQISLASADSSPALQVSCSFDSVSSAGRKIERQIKVFTEQLRGLVAKPACNNSIFYGIASMPVSPKEL